MHQDYLLVITHLGAAFGPLVRAFNANSETSLNSTPFFYTSPEDLYILKIICNQTKEARILVDILSFNYRLQSPTLSEVCNFLYYLGDPRRSITSLVQDHKYTLTKAYDYYAFRLQRISSIIKHTPKANLLTWDTLNDDTVSKKISSRLHLKNKLYFSTESADKIPTATGAIADKAVAVYEKYFEKIKEGILNQTSPSN